MRAYTNGDLKSFANDSDREDSHEKASDDKTGEEASDDEQYKIKNHNNVFFEKEIYITTS